MELLDRRKVEDAGIDRGVENLTPERIEKTINAVLGPASARIEVFLQTCMHCGLCSNACHQHLSRNCDPTYSPVAKVKNTIWEMKKRKGKVSPEFIRQMARIAFVECNGCRKCSMYCPFGIDIAFMVAGLTRRILHLLDVVPLYLQDTVNAHAETSNQMRVQPDEWIDTLMWQEEDARDEVVGARIPLDVEGADIMYSVIAPEPKILAQLLGNIAQVMKVAGLNWTMPSTDGWDNSNMGMFTGDFDTSGRIEQLHWETAMRLKVKKVVMGECGHAFRGAVYDGPRYCGWKKPPIPMVHAVDFYHDLIFSGRIKIAKKFDKPVTFQEPCNIVRGAGLGVKLREVMNALCSDFRDVTNNYEHNFCCGAGGGVVNAGPPWTKTRVRGNRVKAEQLEATGAEYVVTPCHNCHTGIEDVLKEYDLKMHTKFILELLVDAMEIPEELQS